jgi:regulator of nucleoside diphosphate kinase
VKVTVTDRHRLKDSIFSIIAWVDEQHLDCLELLDQKLDSAEIILDPMEIPPDLVTMRSRVKVRSLSDAIESGIYTLLYPFENEPLIKKASVISPLGAALFGERHGNTVELPNDSGAVAIEGVVYQPEAKGHYHL